MKRFIGLDAGSVSVKLAVMDQNGAVIGTEYVRHKGNPLLVAYDLLKKNSSGSYLSVTGSAGKLIAEALGISSVNEVVALSYSTRKLYPQVKTIIEMGGEDSKLVLLHEGGVKEFSMNSVCAAGTGSFLDQQAERLKLSIEEFSELALKSEKPPRIAGRCSVFAKSDMIHLQQIATPMEDIVAGLCFAVARNFKGSICKNMVLPRPIGFLGGVAANKGVARGFKEVLPAADLIIPEHFAVMPAIGAVMMDMEQGIENLFDLSKLENYIGNLQDEGSVHKPLCSDNDEFEKRHQVSYYIHQIKGDEKVNAYLGIDVGSISTNLAVLDEEGRLLSKRYLMTAGRPIDAVRQGLDEIGKEIGDRLNILGVGTTGSGRYMIADFVSADIVKNEITAQARAAAEIDPDVDTIFEIGGQDSKYISIKDGIIVDFEMNKACAAGTGSFLEEQAEKLDISIKNDFARIAFNSEKPCSLGERCTVFMENSLLSRQQKGTPKEDLVSGLSYSIVQNYINRVVSDKKIGDKIFFQGGTAFNKSVVAAFEKYLDRHIIVPPHHDVTGAIGMAIIVKEHMKTQESGVSRQEAVDSRQGTGTDNNKSSLGITDNGLRKTTFKGFDLSRRQYTIKSFECKGCDNMCEINRVKMEGEEHPLFYGSRCEKYDVKRKKNGNDEKGLPDLFAEREAFLIKSNCDYAMAYAGDRNGNRNGNGNGRKVIRIGIPRIFFFQDFLPYWSTLLWELGFEVVLSDNTNRQIISKGLESNLAESCFPHKVAHGHIKDLLEEDVDAIFMPSFINFNPDTNSIRSFACPYAQTMPYIASAAFGKEHFLVPVVNLERGEAYFINEIHKSLKPFNISKSTIKKAMKISEGNQKEFISSIKKRGREVLENIPDRSIVIVGRSYNAFDPGINLEIPKKLAALGVFSIPMDYLPLEVIDISRTWENMYWRSGQSILKAAEIIRSSPKLYALYIGNFSCGPDSFIQKFFEKSISGKPYLQIEIDEHSADAGVITRCEAFIDSISSRDEPPVNEVKKVSTLSINKGVSNKIVFIPRMSDHAFALAAAFKTCGLDAEVMDTPDSDSIKLGRRYVSGKECYPCAITTGDMVKKVMSPDFDPDRAVFFMPSGTGPCRFGQYNVLHRLILDEIGYPKVPIHSPNQDGAFYSELGIVGKEFARQAWMGIIATDLLTKCLHETRPYEINRGETDDIYKKYLFEISKTLVTDSRLMMDLMNEIKTSFSGIPRNNEQRPLIGIIGEIFVRLNAFANENIVRKVEELGGEVWLSPMDEWVYYVNRMSLRKCMIRMRNNSISKKVVNDMMKTMITSHIQKGIDRKFSAPFEGFLKTVHEPSTRQLMRNAAPYIDDSFEGETILSMGKAIDYVKSGASGIISAMPFGCMPGTIVGALLKGVKKDWGIPILSASYDGVEATCAGIQLEAFMHQATEYTVVNKQ